MSTGRTQEKFIRVLCDDLNGTPREPEVDSVSGVGFSFNSIDLTVYGDAVVGYLSEHPMSNIEITGPLSNLALAAASASTVAPVFSGSLTLFKDITTPTWTTPLGFCIAYGIRNYYATGDPVFGVVAPTATTGYLCYEFTVSGVKYKASVRPIPGAAPAWGAALLT